MIWVVNGNATTCHIYHYDKHPHPGKLTLVKELSHPENRLKASEYLTSDKPGHYQTDGSARGAYSPHADPKETEIDFFSQQIAKELQHGRTNNSYQQLILITPPQINGLLLKHLDVHVKNLIINKINKNLTHLASHELLDFLQNNAEYPD